MSDTVRLTIDGREVIVPRGTTILDAAASLGIRIPTLCYLNGSKPLTSCFVCLVHVDGREAFVPACGTEAHEGMRVVSSSPEVLDARRTAFELLLSEHHGDCEGPCTIACPAGLDIPTMIEHLERGDSAAASASARERILFNAVLGRICPAFCERACRRADFDASVSIAALQRETGDRAVAAKTPETPAPATGKRVAIIGAGPAGLTAAYYLLRSGHAVTIVDANDKPGGAWRTGVPEFRLPRAALDGEIDVLRALGAEFRMGVRIHTPAAFADLRAASDAVLVACGAWDIRPLAIPGAELTRSGMQLLRELNAGARPPVGREVVLIAAGSPGTDEARAALRLGAERVTLLRPRVLAESLKSAARFAVAEAEGVAVVHGCVALGIQTLPGGRFVVATECGGKPASFEADMVIASVDREPDMALFRALGLETARRGLAADAKTLAMSLPGVFAAGECVRGPDYGARAVAMGRHAAASIEQFLRGKPVTGEARMIHSRMGHLTLEELAEIKRTSDPAPRCATVSMKPAKCHGSFDEVDGGLAAADVVRESRRCLQCSCLAKDDCRLREFATEYSAGPGAFKGAHRPFARDLSHPKVLYEAHKCVLCGLCIRAASEAGEKLGLAFVGRGFPTTVAVPFHEQLARGLDVSAEACVEACPTGALAWKRRHGEWPARPEAPR